MATWVCVGCGDEYPENVNFCTDCGSDRIAELDDTSGEPTTRADLEWRCEECGHPHVKNSPPCNKCGNMTLEARDTSSSKPTTRETIPQTNTGSTSGPRDITAVKVLCYVIGIPIALLGVAALQLSIVGGPLLFLSGAIVTPTFRGLVEDRFNVRLHRGAVLLIAIVSFATSLFFFGS